MEVPGKVMEDLFFAVNGLEFIQFTHHPDDILRHREEFPSLPFIFTFQLFDQAHPRLHFRVVCDNQAESRYGSRQKEEQESTQKDRDFELFHLPVLIRYKNEFDPAIAHDRSFLTNTTL
jgi:hypothetical protein